MNGASEQPRFRCNSKSSSNAEINRIALRATEDCVRSTTVTRQKQLSCFELLLIGMQERTDRKLNRSELRRLRGNSRSYTAPQGLRRRQPCCSVSAAP